MHGVGLSIALEESALFTTALLKQRGLFKAAVSTATRSPDVSPFRERQTDAFLRGLCRHPDPLVAAVAGFERALLAVRLHGATGRFELAWPRDPYEVLHSLLTGTPVDDRSERPYLVEIGDDIPGGFRVEPCRRADRPRGGRDEPVDERPVSVEPPERP